MGAEVTAREIGRVTIAKAVELKLIETRSVPKAHNTCSRWASLASTPQKKEFW